MQGPNLDRTVFNHIFLIDNEYVATALVSPQCALCDEQGGISFAEETTQLDKHSRQYNVWRGISESSTQEKSTRAGIDTKIGEIEPAFVGIPRFIRQSEGVSHPADPSSASPCLSSHEPSVVSAGDRARSR